MSKQRKSTITVRIGEQVHSKLKDIAVSTGVSVSDLIRICIQGELPKIEEKYVGGKSRRDN